jgi:drug/metabolite transporter (DMT)-like permease
MSAAPSRLKADLLLVLLAAIWGSAFIAQTYAGNAGLAFYYNGACFTLAGILLLPFSRGPISKAQWGWMVVAGVLLFGGSALQQLGLFYTRVANASFLTSLYVIFTPFLLWVAFGERPGVVHVIAVLLAVVGAFLLSTAGRLEFHLGDVMEVGGAVFWALHILVAAKYAARFPSIQFAAIQFLVCGALNFAAGIGREDAGKLLETSVMLATLYRAVLSIAFGYTLQLWAQKYTPPTDASLIFALESVFAALAAAWLLHERLLAPQLAGCALILLAAALSQVRAR